MSLSVDGTWKAGTRATTARADGARREGAPAPAAATTQTHGTPPDPGGKYHPYIHGPRRRKDVEPEVVEVIAEVAAEVIEEAKPETRGRFTKAVSRLAEKRLKEQLLNEGYAWAAIYGRMIADEYRKIAAARNADLQRIENEKRLLMEQQAEEEQIVMMLFNM